MLSIKIKDGFVHDVKLKQVRIILKINVRFVVTFNLCSKKLTAKKKYTCGS